MVKYNILPNWTQKNVYKWDIQLTFTKTPAQLYDDSKHKYNCINKHRNN